MKLKLTIELVPKTCWVSNVRSILSESDWDKIKKITNSKAKYRCEICNGVGPKWPVECHEIWNYNDKKKIQTLEGLISLCPSCHEVKHIGFANVKGRFDIALNHFMKINNLSEYDASKYIQEAFNTYQERSNYEWKIDLSYLKTLGFNVKNKR